MSSDLRILRHPLGKRRCTRCGLVLRPPLESFQFDDSYELYAHAAGHSVEVRRQELWARWISTILPRPRSIFEAGAGNGSFLLAIRALWNNCVVSGVEPALRAAANARESGVPVATGVLRATETPEAELAIAVNVIEHTPDPAQFIRSLASHSTQRLAVVCPDGSAPNSELLIADHVFSFSPSHITMLFEGAGFGVDVQQHAPPALGSFFLTSGVRMEKALDEPRVYPERIRDGTADYLKTWSSLDDILSYRLSQASEVGCFGAGEAAGLLRGYAPKTWSRVSSCFVDDPNDGYFGNLPIRHVSKAPRVLLLAVRPQSQPQVARRLEAEGHHAIRWDDVIER